jgi:predicted aspartyl protease
VPLVLAAVPACSRPAAGSWPPAALPALGWAEVPLDQVGDGLLVADAEVQGDRLRLLVDGGAATLAIDRAAAERLGLALVAGAGKAVGLGAGGVAARLTRLPAVQLGPLTTAPLTAYVLDLAPINQSLVRRGERPVDGVLGADFLHAHRAVIDYPGGRLYLKARD